MLTQSENEELTRVGRLKRGVEVAALSDELVQLIGKSATGIGTYPSRSESTHQPQSSQTTCLGSTSSLAGHLRSNCGAVAALSLEPQLQPVALGTSIPPHLNGRIQCGDSRIDASVAVKIRKDDTAVQPRGCKLRANALRHVDKPPAKIAKDSILLRLIYI